MSLRFDTIASHAGQPNDPVTGSVNVPIYQTSTYEQLEPGVSRGFDYSRTSHPTRLALEKCVAALEGGSFGLAFASGMAAINGVVSILESGDHVVSTRDLYGGAWRLFTKLWSKFGVQFTFVDAADPLEVERAIRPETRLVWLETPSNPLLRIIDIRACAEVARRAGVVTVVDNTFATPCIQRPLELGADVVLHSTTKYINGHSDALGGAVVVNDPGLFERLRFFQNAIGAVPGPQDCFLILRGSRTLSLRIEKHCDSAEAIATDLSRHPDVENVIYPGLDSHPGHRVARRQMRRFGAVVSIDVGSVDRARDFVSRLELFTLAESLGGIKSLISHPATMTHASVEPAVRRKIGITDGLVRLSIGLEDPADLLGDIDNALRGRLSRREVIAI
jgi:cystathionine beta-lyase/cystathionine gamma-synthase